MRGANRDGMIYESAALAPVVPTARSALEAAAAAGSLEEYVAEMRWMHPLYAPMREAMEDPRFSESQRRQIWSNLARVRAIPAIPRGRHILVDAASARLWMYEDGQAVNSMKVVVGKPELQTPMMAGFIRYAIVNPYWNVPADLVRNNIAANVLDKGVGYLRERRLPGVRRLERRRAAGSIPRRSTGRRCATGSRAGARPPAARRQQLHGQGQVRVPQRAGHLPARHARQAPAARGRAPAQLGLRPARGCRAAAPLADGHAAAGRVREARAAVTLPELVPVYITYLTAMPQGGKIAFNRDPYWPRRTCSSPRWTVMR